MEKKKNEISGTKEIALNGVVKKTQLFFYAFVIIGLMTSCSKLVEELKANEPDTKSILVEESPWLFSDYEISVIEDDDGSGLSSQEIEDDMNLYSTGISFTFNTDGTGFIEIPGQGSENWVWTLTDDRLKTVSDTQTDRYTFFSADRNQFTFESRTTTIHLKDSVQYNVTHVGKYFFK